MPASYPAAVKTFATRSNGATIDASHIQDLQDEVTAIESGLLNGTAPINSSGAQVASLNVLGAMTAQGRAQFNGGSTFAGTVQVNGNSTIAGSLNVTGNSTFAGNVNFTGTVTGVTAQNVPRVRVSHSAAQQIPSGSWAGLNWDTNIYDSTAMHSTTTNSSRLTFTASTGIYHVGAQITVSTLATGHLLCRIMVNDSSECLSQTHTNPSDTFKNGINMSGDIRVASTADYITVLVQATGSTGRVAAESSNTAMGFFAHLVST